MRTRHPLAALLALLLLAGASALADAKQPDKTATVTLAIEGMT